MPRKYIRAIGKRPYACYSQEQLEKALVEVSKGQTLRLVEKKYNIPRSTLARHKNRKNTGKYGRPPVFQEEEETIIAECIATAGDWGFPLTKYDIRCLVKAHLDRKDVSETRFKSNFPGPDWTECFIKRHQDKLTSRLSQNIKRARAAVDENIINDYFNELEKTLQDVEPALIVNYDETNLCDDPKRQRVLVRRKCRHPERIMDSSKSSTSVMFTCAGNGHVLPIYINYKAEHLYNTWTEGGPPGTVYNRTKSGWFTMETFEDWFKTVALPYFRKFDKEKNKVLVGDNLASHVSKWVIEKCIAENIKFVLLPPNSTGLCQPLDVAYFKPLKSKWSQVLSDWKLKNRGVIPKDTFPRLLKRCLEKMADKTLENVKAGFKAAGLIPLNRNEILKRLPRSTAVLSKDSQNPQEWVESFKDFLQETRAKETQPLRTVKRKRLNIKPGASVVDSENKDYTQEEPPKIQRKKKQAKKAKTDTEETDTDATISLCSDEDDDFIDFFEIEDDNNDVDNDESILDAGDLSEVNMPSTSRILRDITHNNTSRESEENAGLKSNEEVNFQEIELSKGDFLVAKFLYNEGTKKSTEKQFVGEIIDYTAGSHFYVRFMRKSTKTEDTFIFPQVEDDQLISLGQVVTKVTPLKVSRGRYFFPKSLRKHKCS